jgi:hypothetical protein
MGWADAVGGKGRLIFLSPRAMDMTCWLPQAEAALAQVEER